MNIVHAIICMPFWLIGWLIGYFTRPILAAFYAGFYHVEAKERNNLIQKLSKEIEDAGETND